MTVPMKALNWPEDYQSWESLAAHCDSIKELSDLEKEHAKRAFTFLREELGDDFLAHAYAEGHPLAANIGNLAPWTRRWVAHFADSLRELRTAENYDRLLTLLKSKERAAEALLTTKFGAMLSRAGFGVTIDPRITVQGIQKVPDMRIIDSEGDEELYVEVSASRLSALEREAREMTWLLLRPLMGLPLLRYTARFCKILSRPHLISLVRQIAELAHRVRQDGAFRELVIDGVLELGVAPEHDLEMLNRWARRRGLEAGSTEGPPYSVDEVQRTKRKMEREQRQLPLDRPNLLIIESLRLFLRSRDIEKVVSELEEAVYEHPHLIAVVVSGVDCWSSRRRCEDEWTAPIRSKGCLWVGAGVLSPSLQQVLRAQGLAIGDLEDLWRLPIGLDRASRYAGSSDLHVATTITSLAGCHGRRSLMPAIRSREGSRP